MRGAALMRRSSVEGEISLLWVVDASEASCAAGEGSGGVSRVGLELAVGAGAGFAFEAVVGVGSAVGIGSPFKFPPKEIGSTSGCEEGARDGMLWFDVGLDVEGVSVSGEGGAGESFASTSAFAFAFAFVSPSSISTSPSPSFCASLAFGEAEREEEEAMDEGRRLGLRPRRDGAFPRRRGRGDGGSELGLYGGSALAVVEDEEPEDNRNGESERSREWADSEKKKSWLDR